MISGISDDQSEKDSDFELDLEEWPLDLSGVDGFAFGSGTDAGNEMFFDTEPDELFDDVQMFEHEHASNSRFLSLIPEVDDLDSEISKCREDDCSYKNKGIDFAKFVEGDEVDFEETLVDDSCLDEILGPKVQIINDNQRGGYAKETLETENQDSLKPKSKLKLFTMEDLQVEQKSVDFKTSTNMKFLDNAENVNFDEVVPSDTISFNALSVQKQGKLRLFTIEDLVSNTDPKDENRCKQQNSLNTQTPQSSCHREVTQNEFDQDMIDGSINDSALQEQEDTKLFHLETVVLKSDLTDGKMAVSKPHNLKIPHSYLSKETSICENIVISNIRNVKSLQNQEKIRLLTNDELSCQIQDTVSASKLNDAEKKTPRHTDRITHLKLDSAILHAKPINSKTKIDCTLISATKRTKISDNKPTPKKTYSTPKTQPTKKMTLITNISSTDEFADPKSDMVFDKLLKKWVGNEDCLDAFNFDEVKSQPVLIPHSTHTCNAEVGAMRFDSELLRWVGNEDEFGDVFDGIDDLVVSVIGMYFGSIWFKCLQMHSFVVFSNVRIS